MGWAGQVVISNIWNVVEHLRWLFPNLRENILFCAWCTISHESRRTRAISCHPFLQASMISLRSDLLDWHIQGSRFGPITSLLPSRQFAGVVLTCCFLVVPDHKGIHKSWHSSFMSRYSVDSFTSLPVDFCLCSCHVYFISLQLAQEGLYVTSCPDLTSLTDCKFTRIVTALTLLAQHPGIHPLKKDPLVLLV